MFKLKEPTEPCDWPVTVSVPQSGGKATKHRFTAKFDYLDDDAFRQLADEGDHVLLERVLVGWGEDLRDEEGEPLPYSTEHRARLIRITYVRRALIGAYGEFLHGRAAGN